MKALKTIAASLLCLILFIPFCLNANADGDVVYSVSEDFSGLEDGVTFTENEGLKKEWTAVQATQYLTSGENGTLHFGPFSQLILNHRPTGAYTFTTAVKVPNNQFFGIFVRSTGEALSGCQYYEHDGTVNENGDADNEGLGATGIYVIPRANRLMLCVKTDSVADAKGIGTDKTFFDLDTDMSADYTDLTFEDDGVTVRISVAGKPVCSVIMSEKSGSDFMSDYPLYTKAEIKDKDGATVKTVANCRISADFSEIAYGMRINSANIDNVRFEEYGRTAVTTEAPLQIKRVDIKCLPEKTEYLIGEELDLSDTFLEVTYENGVKEDVKVTPDMIEGFDSATEGVKLITVNYGKTSAAYSVTVVTEHTEPVVTERETIDFDTSPATSQSAAAQGGNRTVIIIVAVIAAAVIIALLLFIILKGKKPDDEKL